MEFTVCADKDAKSGDLLSLQRQRILAAQIKDSELGEDDVLLPSADTFDNSVESVSTRTLRCVHCLNQSHVFKLYILTTIFETSECLRERICSDGNGRDYFSNTTMAT